MKRFARLFERDGRQVVAMCDEDAEGDAVVTIYFVPPGLGVCSVKLGYGQDGHDIAQQKLDGMTEDAVFRLVDEQCKFASQFAPDEEVSGD